MRRYSRRATLFLIAVCFMPTMSAAPEWMSAVMDETWNYRELQDWVEEEAELSCDLDERIEIATTRILQKETIYLDIESGQVSLFEAARHFRAMDIDHPGNGNGTHEPLRVGSEAELAALAVIRGVRLRVADGPPVLAEIADRFEAAFEAKYGYWPPRRLSLSAV